MTAVAAALRYRLAGTLGAGDFGHALRGLALDHEGAVYAVGDSKVQVFDRRGIPVGSWPTSKDGTSIAVADDDGVWVGQAGGIEIFDAEGQLRDTWSDGARLGLVTALGFTSDGVLAADATTRWIGHFDRQGRFRNFIGDRHRKGGFHIPNGIVDFAVDAGDVVHVANPGMHRVERYTPAGELLGRFGRFDGVDPEGFPGCCNPTNVTLTTNGRVVVTEKAPPRVKVYDLEGNLLSVVATGEAFDPGSKNMDVAVDGRGKIYVADTVRRHIRVFEGTETGELTS